MRYEDDLMNALLREQAGKGAVDEFFLGRIETALDGSPKTATEICGRDRARKGRVRRVAIPLGLAAAMAWGGWLWMRQHAADRAGELAHSDRISAHDELAPEKGLPASAAAPMAMARPAPQGSGEPEEALAMRGEDRAPDEGGPPSIRAMRGMAPVEKRGGGKGGTGAWKSSIGQQVLEVPLDLSDSSYRDLQRAILSNEQGNISTIHPEELVNHFRYLLPSNAGDGKFEIATRLGLAPWAPSHAVALIVIRAAGKAGGGVAGHDVHLKLEAHPAKVESYRLIWRELEESPGASHAVSLHAGQSVAILCEMRPLAGLPEQDWLTVKLDYKSPGDEEPRVMENVISGKPLAWDQAGADYQLAAMAGLLGMKLEGRAEMEPMTWQKILELAPASAGRGQEEKEFYEILSRLAE